MAILESQLETWSHRSQTQTAVNSHEAVRWALSLEALTKHSNPLWLKGPEARLQGSYRNYTNVWADSDVDVLVTIPGHWYYDVKRLPLIQQEQYMASHPPSTYPYRHYRSHVLDALRSHFGWSSVDDGDKAIKIAAKPGERLAADVVPCWEYRDYHSFNGNDEHGCIRGVAFYTRTSNQFIVNYPEQHYDNGVKKHEQTGQRFKPTVRIFKNARNWLVDSNRLGADIAPSYFIQCLLYNVPANQFVDTHKDAFLNVLSWLVKNLDAHRFICQNGIVELFGNGQDQWSEAAAIQFLKQMTDLYTNGT